MKKRKKWIIILVIIMLLVLCYIAFARKNAEEKREDHTKNYDNFPEDCDIVGNTSNYIRLTSEENASWTVTETATNKTYKFTIKEKNGGLVGLPEGSYTLTKNDDNDKKEYHFVFDSFHHSYELEFADEKLLNNDNGAFVALVLDKNDQPVEGITLNFYDADGEFYLQGTTNKDGRVAIINIAPNEESVYYVEQDDIESPKRKTFYVNRYDVKGIKFHINENGIIE